jgi:hypothetical protein
MIMTIDPFKSIWTLYNGWHYDRDDCVALSHYILYCFVGLLCVKVEYEVDIHMKIIMFFFVFTSVMNKRNNGLKCTWDIEEMRKEKGNKVYVG